MFNILGFSLLILSVGIVSSSILEHDGTASIKLYHSLTDNLNPTFTYRGNITIQSLRSGQATVEPVTLTGEERQKLRDLAASNQLYILKADVTSHDGSTNTFISAIKACMLVESKLEERLSVSLDYTGRIIGVTAVIASTSTCEGAQMSIYKLKSIITNVYIRHPEVGAIPDTASYIQKLEREREAKERGEVKDNRTFFARYWMYIVPFIILMVISSATNPEVAAGVR